MAGYLTTEQAKRIFEICAFKIEQSSKNASDSRVVLSRIARKINEDTISRQLFEPVIGGGFCQKLPNDEVIQQTRYPQDLKEDCPTHGH